MKLLVLDGETFYSKEYSLRHMTPAEYVLDPRFEMIGLAYKEIGGTAGGWVEGPDVASFFASLNPAEITTISHNALFDNCIWAYRYNFIPALMIDTLGMARSILNLKQNSLAAVAKYLKAGSKGDEIVQALGLRLADIKARPNFYRSYRAYALKDVFLCERIYNLLIKFFPPSESFIQDLVLRCAVQPVLLADVPLLSEHLVTLRKRKEQLLRDCGYDKAALMSTVQFKEALEELGVEVSMKQSPTGRVVPAFAKTDPFMRNLVDYTGADDDDVNYKVQTLAAARLCHKSTIEETRTERFLAIAKLPWPNGQPMLPVPLRYGGAHTHRLSGEWKTNLQNLPRDQQKSRLRSALLAPPGCTLITADLAQIECRILAQLCGQRDLTEQFIKGEDVYANFGSILFAKMVDKVKTPNERWIAKTAVLGLGYGCGVDRFNRMVVTSAKQYDIKLDGLFDEGVASKTVNTYRSTFYKIPRMWNALDKHLLDVLNQPRAEIYRDVSPVRILPGRIRLPNRMYLRYDIPDLSLYGAKLLENITQALARIVIMDAALRIKERGWRFILQSHDELVFAVPHDQVQDAIEAIQEEMIKPPEWMLGLPLAAEIKTGRNYGAVK